MGRLIIAVLIAACLTGCAAVASISAVPAAVFDSIIYMFQGREVGVPLSMRASLVSVQKALRKISFDVDVLVPQEDGYAILFGDKKIDGHMKLRRETDSLTTIYVKVRKGMGRQDAIEEALIREISNESKRVSAKARFRFAGYLPIYRQPKESSPRVGWFRKGAKLSLKKAGNSGWMKVKLPGGTMAYVRRQKPADTI